MLNVRMYLNSSMLYVTSNKVKLSSQPHSGYSYYLPYLLIQSACEVPPDTILLHVLQANLNGHL